MKCADCRFWQPYDQRPEDAWKDWGGSCRIKLPSWVHGFSRWTLESSGCDLGQPLEHLRGSNAS